MKQIVVYESQTGFTRQYAQWIAENLICECVSRKDAEKYDLSSYDRIIYGGWTMAGQVYGLDKIRKLNVKNLVVYGVGMAPSREEIIKKLILDNKLEGMPFYYFEGGYRPEKLNFIHRWIMNTLKKSLEKKRNKTEEDFFMLEAFAGKQKVCQEAVTDLVVYCKDF